MKRTVDNQAAEALGCPEAPPAWLENWPGAERLGAEFASGIRAYAGRVLRQEKDRSLSWGKDRLVLRVGAQRATWQLRGSQWQPSCTCGYGQGKCPHAFAAIKLFQEVAEARGWLGNGAADSAARTDAPTVPRSRPRRNSRRASMPTQLNFEWDTKPAESARLTVEVDVHHQPGMYVLRFYRDGAERSWLSLQGLYNLCRRAQAKVLDNWPERDVRFLAWLAGRLNKRSLLRSNIKVLKLEPQEFARWQDRWAEDPGRFIERTSQQPFGAGREASFHFELSPAGDDRVEIAAIVTLADGTSLNYHELLSKISANRSEFMVDGQLIRLDPPVTWDLLNSVFAKKSPTMERRHVLEHLPHLLEQRLDLVHGPLTERRRRMVAATVTLRPDGANFAGRITLGGQDFHSETGRAVGPLTAKNGKFQLELFETEDRDALREFLRRTEAEIGEGGRFRIAGGGERARQLVEAWKALPDSVKRRPDDELIPLLEGVGPAVAQVHHQQRGAGVEFDVLWTCGGRALTGGEMRDLVRSEGGVLRTSSGEWLRMTPEDARETAKRFEAVLELEATTLLVPEARRAAATVEQTAGVELRGLKRDAGRELLTAPAPEPLGVPDALVGVLRSYQREGFEFLAERLTFRTGPLLADDMGLGKTLQVLSVLEALRLNGGLPTFAGSRTGGGRLRALVVCPASVTSVWRSEAQRFCPELRCALYRGSPDQRGTILEADDWDLLIANYALIRQDQDVFQEAFFDVVVLDEAQAIKNPDAQITRAVKAVPRHCGLALTGTPLENRTLDLWSIADFLNPGFLGDRADFEEQFAPSTPDAGPRLARRIRPVLMRRTKGEVAAELPPLTQEVISVDMTEEQRAAYQRELVRARQAVKSRGPMELFAALTRLRQLCCHPDLIEANHGMSSGKLDELVAMIEELAAEGHSALVFSQFVRMLELIAPRIEQAGIRLFTITGKTPVERRAERIESFNASEEPAVFLLSLRAAGTGITLTKADYVFIYDPWWNPAVERQAIDRTHRIGQQQPVMAYRMIAANSVEERVLALQREKAELFEQVVGATENAVPEGLTRDVLESLLTS